MCDRQLCVDCQWCFIVEGTYCYCILYFPTVTVHKTIYPTASYSKTLRTLHTRAHVYANVAVIKLSILLLAYNIEGMESSHRCPSHSFLLQSEVSVTVQSVCVQTMVRT